MQNSYVVPIWDIFQWVHIHMDIIVYDYKITVSVMCLYHASAFFFFPVYTLLIYQLVAIKPHRRMQWHDVIKRVPIKLQMLQNHEKKTMEILHFM